ncbi:MAG: SpoIIE family protein phosphatase [Verrucomicrobiota bacterium]
MASLKLCLNNMSRHSHRLLVLESNREAAGSLRSHGFHVEFAPDAVGAIERLARESFDLGLFPTSILGPAPESIPAALHALLAEVAIVLIADDSDIEAAQAALRNGVQDYVVSGELTSPRAAEIIRKAIDRQQGQRAARHDQHLLEVLMDRVPDAVYFKDTESRFLRVSRAQARKFGLASPAEAVGKSDADFFTEAHARQAREDERRVITTGLPVVGIEEKETWPDGSVSWVSTTKLPMRDPNGRIIGTFGVSRDITARKEAELALAERTRQLRQKNQQVEEELKMARELQLAMLPQRFPCTRANGNRNCALEFFSFYLPSGSVSGDFYDVVQLSDSAVGMFICDVMGHDVRAALVTAMMRALVQDLSRSSADPGQLLAQINQGLAGLFRQTGATMFATALYLIADVATGELRYASAAHPDAFHIRRQPGSVEILHTDARKRGPALGLFEEASFPTSIRTAAPGDLILMFTDGLIEAEGADQECFSQERLADAVRRHASLPAREMLDKVVGEVRGYCGQEGFSDDVSLVGMEVRSLAPVP